ncbi:S8 family serine peptidase [Dokdonella sp.]|uniref:S8 family serine peptidase n=1 Tax=Dokdonella sp. TaxID=2291710 RepID=UPI001B0E9925|nr:S8 family serine peptidase [Dokdonella sp.]MBO9663360.1 S8 family serine peptidase [Dokdonella sp.]
MLGECSPSQRRPARRRWTHLSATVLCSAALVFGSGVLAAGKPVAGTPKAPLPSVSGPGAAPVTPAGVEISAKLQRDLLSGGKRNFTIELRERADLSAAYRMDWLQRGRYVHQRLRETAERSQARLRAMLDVRGARYHPYWIKNAIVVEHGDLATLQASAAFAEVARIREAPKTALVKPEPQTPHKSAGLNADGVAPNIAQVGADRVWASGTTGDGVTVGILDDGVFATHEALWRQYRGNLGAAGVDHDYNWYTPIGQTDTPSSNGGHGAHVAGTVVGDNGAADPAQRKRIGMAPGAKWIACQGLAEDAPTEFTLPACGEFMLAPTRTDGSAPDPDRRPQVVNNSWGSFTCDGTANDFFRDIVENWIAAGIFPVFAAGNAAMCGFPEPAGLSTVLSPASLGAAFAVGSSGNHDGLYAPHSLWGPSAESSLGLPNYPDPRGWPTLKPQVVAPGVDIVSSIDGASTYEAMTGTSMSAPHITGLVALMLEAGECLRGDYATLGTMIMQTARPIDYASGGSPPPGPGNVPNYAAGWGEIDAPAAVDAAAHACGPQGIARGTVTDASGRPVSGAKVEIFADANVRIYQSVTENDGSYVRRLPVNPNGGYTIRISAYGYLPSSESGIVVQDDVTVVHDVQLATAATYKINGRVTDATTGWPLHAKIVVSGYPGQPVWTDPATGRYSIRLAEGSQYRFDVDTDIPGYRAQTREVASNGGAAQDFALPADLVACSAPGYAYTASRLSEGFENNGNGTPSGWTRSSNGLGWLFGTQADLASSYFPVTEHGRFAASNDQLGAGEGWENDASADYLTTPSLNLLGLAEPVLTYRSFYFKDGYASVQVQASTDGGATWTALGVPKSASWNDPWTREAVSLAGVVSANTRIRFHSSDGTTPGNDLFGTGWAIDDVAVVGGCAAPPSGGLVFGHVRDANTGAGLNGAEVRIDGGASVATAISPDASMGEGFFVLHAPSGTSNLVATRGSQPVGYGDAGATPTVASGANTLVDLALPAGRLRVYPNLIAGSVELGTTRNVQVSVGNTGTAPLQFGFEQAPIEEHFESGTFPPAGWTVDTPSGCGWAPIDFESLGNYAGGAGDAAAVQLFPCMGGADTDTSLISPPLDLSDSRTASVGFFLALFEGADSVPRLDVDVSVDGGTNWTTVHSETHDNNGMGPGALIEIDLSAFVGASDVRVRFHFTAVPPWGWVIVDQVHLFNTVNSSPIFDLAPDAGSLAAGESRNLNATLDARAVEQPGVYEVAVRMAEDTPYDWQLGDVTVRMTVTAPASWGWLAGSVRGLGYCEADPRTLEGATIAIVDRNGTTHTTTSAADGSYKYWVDSALGPFTLTATAADHLAASAQFPVVAGAQATADFDLRPLQACVVTDPPALSARVEPGQSLQQPFVVMNTGAAGATWTLRAGGDPAVKTLVPWVQNLDMQPEADVSFGCRGAFSGDNRWMRKFDLSERQLPGDEVLVTKVNFAVDSAISTSGSQPLTVSVYKLVGEFTLANLQRVGQKVVDVADSGSRTMSVSFDPPLSVSGDTVLVAELSVPDGTGTGSLFYPGGNGAGETAPAYWASTTCGYPEPVTYAEAGFGWIHLVLGVETMASDPCGANATPVDWLGVSSQGGTIAADTAVPLQATFDAGSRADGSYRGSMCLTPGRNSHPFAVPVTLNVGAGGDAIFADGFDGR